MEMTFFDKGWRHKALMLIVFFVGCAFALPSHAQKVIVKPPEKKTEVPKPPVKVDVGKKEPKKDPPKGSKKEPTVKPRPTEVHTVDWAVNQLRKNMVRMEGGTFTMGIVADGDDENMADNAPAHQVTLSPFFRPELLSARKAYSRSTPAVERLSSRIRPSGSTPSKLTSRFSKGS